MRALLLICLALSLCSCSYRLEVTPCRQGKRLAFQISEEPGLLWGSSPLPLWKVVVYKREKGKAYSPDQQRWHTQDLRGSRDGYNLVVYGSRLNGWSILKQAQPLREEQEYWVTIVAEGGAYADVGFIPAEVVAHCRMPRDI
jgi:hypothetical protein